LSFRPSSALGTTLPHGQTLRGTYVDDGVAVNSGDGFYEGISFGLSLSPVPTVNYIPNGGSVPAACAAGSAANPQATSGNLCIFEAGGPNVASAGEFDAVSSKANIATTFGFGMYVTATVSGAVYVKGSWAVTG
jgi:hypothetical protein